MGPQIEDTGKRIEERSIGSIYDQGTNGFYKPCVLKWPFIVTVIFLLTHTLTLVIYVQQMTSYSSGNPMEEMKLERPDAISPRTENRFQSTSHLDYGTKSTQSNNALTSAPRQVVRREDTTITQWQITTVTIPVPSTIERTITTTLSASTVTTTTWFPVTISLTTETETIYENDIKSAFTAAEPQTITITIERQLSQTEVLITEIPAPRIITTTAGDGVAVESNFTPAVVVNTSPVPASITTMLVETVIGGDPFSLSSFFIFTTEPGSLVTKITTPSPFVFTTLDNGVKITATSTPPPQTYITREGATVRTLATVVMAAAPDSKTGPFEASTIATYHESQSPTSYTTDISGTPTTIVTTPPPRTRFSTLPIVWSPPFEASSIATFLETQPPVTYTTDVSGTPTTIVTTPPPKSKLSTVPIAWSPKTITRSTGGNSGPSSKNETTVIVDGALYNLTPNEYFAGAFLPTIVAIILGIPISIIDTNARLIQPFHALKLGGRCASSSLDLTFSGPINTFLMPCRLLLIKQPVTSITSLLTWASWLLVPLASEAIALQVFGHCGRFSIEGCAVSLGVSSSPKNALVVLLAAMVILLLILLYVLRDWHTGVYCYPWSIGGIATLTTDAHLRKLIGQRIQDGPEQVTKASKDTRFRLGVSDHGYYTIMAEDRAQETGASPVISQRKTEISLPYLSGMKKWTHRAKRAVSNTTRSSRTPFICLTYTWRVVFLAFHMGVLALVIYYRVAQNTRTADILGFKPGFGSRFLFSALGKIISLFWSDFLISMATIHPFVLLSPPHPPQPASSSILIPRPTNEFSVIYWTMTQLITTKGNLKASFSLILASFVAILSKFLPVLMTNIPYTLQQTYPSYIVCTTISMAILSLMIVTLLGSILLMGNWPYLPSDPRTIAGMMYYLLNSSFYDSYSSSNVQSSKSKPDDSTPADPPGHHDQISPAKPTTTPGKVFAGLGHLKQAERDKQITDLNYRYAYGELLPTRETHPTTQNAQSLPNPSTLSRRKKTSKTPRTMGIYIEHGNSAA
ncbi:hypothetical protein QBC37DRAFT_457025 [Rhypophila decipiens]|uniref:Uncharacterized protein n=1 Tax=Rhypophila decipiens TaxID=261697 RepID=A0AAN6YJF1_9PEZI|nr:hypothetical protein QBC37DRAFT_457025 [Rhypophila decipiens]